MSDSFPQTWYRPARYGNELLEELEVHSVTKEMIAVKNGNFSIRRQYKAGAKPSKLEALRDALEDAARSEQYAERDLASKVRRRERLEAAIAEQCLSGADMPK